MTEAIQSVVDILGAGGAIARRLRDYEPRPEQLEMALAVESALQNRHHLVAEAGTGVGKSFAYLIPAILAAQGRTGFGEQETPNYRLHAYHQPSGTVDCA
jgi:ATP-dependent DNA helicase DinG